MNTYVGNEPMVIGFNGEVNKNIDFSFGENTEDGFEKNMVRLNFGDFRIFYPNLDSRIK